MNNDESSYRRYMDGDNDAFALLVEEHYDALALYLNTFVHSLPVSEELAEDTFVRIAVRKPAFRGQSSFRTWLFAIGRNIARDYLRKETKLREKTADGIPEWTADDTEIERDYILGEQKKHLHRAMLKLKREYRTVLWLVYFEDMTTEQASVAIGKSKSSTEHLVRRAKQALKEQLLKEGFVYEES
ncbi:MAG: RNA polymerase sigma factor [Clostridiales bacterium]|nr:RNA polymerase sigma factor [Candidatus Coliplasma caballi]